MDNQNKTLLLDTLVHQVLQGDAKAYQRLLAVIGPALRRYFAHQFKLGSQADDMTQETLLAVHTKFHTYSPAQPFTPWLYAIAKYKAIDYLRAVKRRPVEMELPEADMLAAPQNDEVAETHALQAALSSLSQRDRDLLKYAKLDGLSLDEIGQRMNLSLSAVKVGIHRAMKRVATFAASKEE